MTPGSTRIRSHWLSRKLATLLGAGILVAFIVVGGWFLKVALADLPGPADLRRIGDMEQATTIYDAHDTPVFAIYREQRIEIPLSAVSPHLVRALIAVEDQRFYSHRGIDAVRVLAAAAANVRHRRAAQGGSTLTQQLVRQSFLTPDKTLTRKVREIVLAARLERIYSKDEILTFYLNKVYFGDGLYGAEAASLGYFGKHARDLTVADAALLAGLVKSPSMYAPTVSRERALARRAVVLRAMVETHAIDQRMFQQASHAPLVLRDALTRDEPFGQYFKEAVRRELVDRFGWQRVYQGGLRVYTTLDPELQHEAEVAVRESLQQLDERRARQSRAATTSRPGTTVPPAATIPHPEDRLEAALIAMDPSTAYVRAMVGGREDGGEFNRATQARRQPGSAFKPFVYAAALESGYTAASVIADLDEPIMTPQGAWTPEDEHSDASSMTIRTALRTSSNRAAVRMLHDVGMDATVRYAKQLGVGTLPSVPSLALGSGEVTLASLTAAYSAFANGGLAQPPVLIRQVADADGTVLFEAPHAPRRAISEATAYIMTSMMADVVNAGTAYKARTSGFTLPAAGKTGTTNNYNDAWFVGFTPHLIAGVWVGFDQPHTIMRQGYAGDVAVPLWAAFMKTATHRDPPDWFRPPRNVVGLTVCRVSGMLPAPGCSNVATVDDHGEITYRSMLYTEFFVRGTEPTETCPVHGGGTTTIVAGAGLGTVAPASEASPRQPSSSSMASTSGTTVTGGTVAQPAKKKRGFWSRLFGLGKDDDKGKQEEDGQKPPR